MYGKLYSSRTFHVFLLVAFVYQLNVCPCGNLEHNGWYQLGKSLLQATSLTAEARQEHDSRHSGLAADDFHCDANGPVVFLAENRGSGIDSRSLETRVVAPQISVFTFQRRSAASFFSRASIADGFVDQLEVRAHFQVYLI